ncbi:MAG: tryptophan synthase subunit alpha [Candidatus Omnitrophica bacterium]|nr:tryptophan synthase subunit alpha [Candidatus Omnitrophota bacterium]
MGTINFLDRKIRAAKTGRHKLFCVFLTCGFPSTAATERLILASEKSGVDIIELGFPFSDPLADGPTIQYSSERALKHGLSIADAFALVRRVRRKGCRVPIVFFGYLNPVYAYGIKTFAHDAREAGLDGLIIPDLPPGEEPEFEKHCRQSALRLVLLVAPTTTGERSKELVRRSQGFVYYVSLRGVTGARAAIPGDLREHLKKLKRMTAKPVLVGFGVSTPEQARAIAQMSDGVIVGSAVIERLKRGLVPAERFIGAMARAVHGR